MTLFKKVCMSRSISDDKTLHLIPFTLHLQVQLYCSPPTRLKKKVMTRMVLLSSATPLLSPQPLLDYNASDLHIRGG